MSPDRDSGELRIWSLSARLAGPTNVAARTQPLPGLTRHSRCVLGLVLAMQGDLPFGDLHVLLDDVVLRRAVVHQATGVVSAQLDISVDDALVVLRARAFQSGMAIGELAEKVMAHNLRLSEVATDIIDRRLDADALRAPSSTSSP